VIQDQKAKIVYQGKIESAAKMKGSVEFRGMGSGTRTGKQT